MHLKLIIRNYAIDASSNALTAIQIGQEYLPIHLRNVLWLHCRTGNSTHSIKYKHPAIGWSAESLLVGLMHCYWLVGMLHCNWLVC